MSEPDWLVRLKAERAELRERIQRLAVFMSTDDFRGLEPLEQGRLVRQYDCMGDYLAVLVERLEAAGVDVEA